MRKESLTKRLKEIDKKMRDISSDMSGMQFEIIDLEQEYWKIKEELATTELEDVRVIRRRLGEPYKKPKADDT